MREDVANVYIPYKNEFDGFNVSYVLMGSSNGAATRQRQLQSG